MLAERKALAEGVGVIRIYFILIIISTCLVFLLSCDRSKPPVRLGLSVNLSGMGGADGEHVRNGALLAVDDINKAGGINGRPLELVVKDDRGTADGAVKADMELMDAGVPVIVGHNQSSTTLAAYPVVTSNNILLITSCSSTTRLTGKDDLFFRTCVDCDLYGKKTAKLLRDRGALSVAFLMDMSNPGFVNAYSQAVEKYYNGRTYHIRFKSGSHEDWSSIMKDILLHQPDAVMLLTEATMTGMALQKLKAGGYKGLKVATLWAQTPELIKYAAGAVQGLSIITYVNPDFDSPEFKSFQGKIESAFHESANARSASCYELMMILAQAMRRAKYLKGPDIAAALLAGKYNELMGSVTFDRYGDVIRPVYEVTISSGRFALKGDI